MGKVKDVHIEGYDIKNVSSEELREDILHLLMAGEGVTADKLIRERFEELDRRKSSVNNDNELSEIPVIGCYTRNIY